MGDVVRLSKPDPERDEARLIQEARAIRERVSDRQRPRHLAERNL